MRTSKKLTLFKPKGRVSKFYITNFNSECVGSLKRHEGTETTNGLCGLACPFEPSKSCCTRK